MEDNRQETPVKADEISKVVFADVQVLAEFVKDVIPDFRKYTRQEIENAVRQRKDYPRGLNTENVLPSLDTVRYDLLYRIPVPGKDRDVGIMVNIESQSRPDPDYRLENRAEFYVSSVFG